MLLAQRVQRLTEADKVAGDQPGSLMDQLIKRVLAVGSGLSPIDRSGVTGDGFTIERHMLSVALHGQLLEIGRKPLQILLVRKHADRLRAEEIVVPDGE